MADAMKFDDGVAVKRQSTRFVVQSEDGLQIVVDVFADGKITLMNQKYDAKFGFVNSKVSVVKRIAELMLKAVALAEQMALEDMGNNK